MSDYRSLLQQAVSAWLAEGNLPPAATTDNPLLVEVEVMQHLMAAATPWRKGERYLEPVFGEHRNLAYAENLPVQIPNELIDNCDPSLIGVYAFVDREAHRQQRRLTFDDVLDAAREAGFGRWFRGSVLALIDAGWLTLREDGESQGPASVPAPLRESPPRPAPHTPEIVGHAAPGEHAVYIHKDETGRVLYVGVTTDFPARTRNHRKASWWRQVAVIEVSTVDSRSEALRRELDLIIRHNPAGNRSDAAFRTDPLLRRELDET